jgi:hypothetical protein
MAAFSALNFWLVSSFHTTVIIKKICCLVNGKKQKNKGSPPQAAGY